MLTFAIPTPFFQGEAAQTNRRLAASSLLGTGINT
jgi:hypothetical protein